MFQCYYQSDRNDPTTRCKNEQEEEWCSEEHKSLWQKENYTDRRVRGIRRKTIEDIQENLRRMAQESRAERFRKQQKLV